LTDSKHTLAQKKSFLPNALFANKKKYFNKLFLKVKKKMEKLLKSGKLFLTKEKKYFIP